MVVDFSLWGDFCRTSAGVRGAHVRGAHVMGGGGRGGTCEGQCQDSLVHGCQAGGTPVASAGSPETAQGEGAMSIQTLSDLIQLKYAYTFQYHL